MECLSPRFSAPYQPKALIIDGANTHPNPVAQFFNLLQAPEGDTGIKCICKYQQKWIAQHITQNKVESMSTFSARCETTSGYKSGFHFVVRENDSGVNVYVVSEPGATNEYSIGFIPGLKLDDF